MDLTLGHPKYFQLGFRSRISMEEEKLALGAQIALSAKEKQGVGVGVNVAIFAESGQMSGVGLQIVGRSERMQCQMFGPLQIAVDVEETQDQFFGIQGAYAVRLGQNQSFGAQMAYLVEGNQESGLGINVAGHVLNGHQKGLFNILFKTPNTPQFGILNVNLATETGSIVTFGKNRAWRLREGKALLSDDSPFEYKSLWSKVAWALFGYETKEKLAKDILLNE